MRVSSLLDAVSFLVLAGYAMPMKYVWENPTPVSIVGPIHGVFFIALCIFLALALLRSKLSFQDCVKVGLAALIPLLPFFLDGWLKKKQLKK